MHIHAYQSDSERKILYEKRMRILPIPHYTFFPSLA